MLRPLLDRVAIKVLKNDETPKKGIILTGSMKEENKIGEVVEVGLGGFIDGKEIEMYVKKGDRVIINNYSGRKVDYENEEYLIVKQSDILAIID